MFGIGKNHNLHFSAACLTNIQMYIFSNKLATLASFVIGTFGPKVMVFEPCKWQPYLRITPSKLTLDKDKMLTVSNNLLTPKLGLISLKHLAHNEGKTHFRRN